MAVLSPIAKAPATGVRLLAIPAQVLARWHLLSLDAPTVAALWTWFVARSNHIELPFTAVLEMAVAVWMLYAADRLMDARLIGARPLDARPLSAAHDRLEARHLFHHIHRSAFVCGILFATGALALLLPRLDARSIHLYLILGSFLAGYFILIHTVRASHRLPKELAVGIFFAAATYIPTVSRRPDLRLALLPSAILFATLCSLNCLFIYAWEHPSLHTDAHAATRLALRHISLLAVLVAFTGAALSLLDRQAPWAVPAAVVFAATFLLLLHRYRHLLASVTLRAAADLVLLTPLLLMPYLRHP